MDTHTFVKKELARINSIKFVHICSVTWLLKNTFYNFFKILRLRIFSSCDHSSGSVQVRAWSVCQAPAPRPESHCSPGWSAKGRWEFESKKNTTYSAASTVTLSFSWCSVLFEFLAQDVKQRLGVILIVLLSVGSYFQEQWHGRSFPTCSLSQKPTA